MKKVLALASVGAFVLSLAGASLAQEKAPAPAPAAPPVRSSGGSGGAQDGSPGGSEGRGRQGDQEGEVHQKESHQEDQEGQKEGGPRKPNNLTLGLLAPARNSPLAGGTNSGRFMRT